MPASRCSTGSREGILGAAPRCEFLDPALKEAFMYDVVLFSSVGTYEVVQVRGISCAIFLQGVELEKVYMHNMRVGTLLRRNWLAQGTYLFEQEYEMNLTYLRHIREMEQEKKERGEIIRKRNKELAFLRMARRTWL